MCYFFLLLYLFFLDSFHPSSHFPVIFPQFSFSPAYPSNFWGLFFVSTLYGSRPGELSASPHHLQLETMAIIIPNHSSLFCQTCTLMAWHISTSFKILLSWLGSPWTTTFALASIFIFPELMTCIKSQFRYWHFMVIMKKERVLTVLLQVRPVVWCSLI